MIEHVWTAVCSNVVIDRESNNASLHNVIDQLNVCGHIAPSTLLGIPFEIISLWLRSDPQQAATGQARVTLMAPSGRSLGSVEYPINLTEFERYRGVVRTQGLPVEGPGRYRYRVELRVDPENEWQQVAAVPLTVLVSPAAD